MRMIRWGFMLALVLAIAPMFALQVFAVGEGVGISPPAISMSIQSAYETPDVPVSLDTGNGIMLSAPDGVSTQPTYIAGMATAMCSGKPGASRCRAGTRLTNLSPALVQTNRPVPSGNSVSPITPGGATK